MDDTSEAAPQEHVAETAAAVMDSSHAEVAEQQSGGAGSAMTATEGEEQVGDVVNEEREQLGGDGEVAVNSPAEGAAPLGGENLSKEREAEEGDREAKAPEEHRGDALPDDEQNSTPVSADPTESVVDHINKRFGALAPHLMREIYRSGLFRVTVPELYARLQSSYAELFHKLLASMDRAELLRALDEVMVSTLSAQFPQSAPAITQLIFHNYHQQPDTVLYCVFDVKFLHDIAHQIQKSFSLSGASAVPKPSSSGGGGAEFPGGSRSPSGRQPSQDNAMGHSSGAKESSPSLHCLDFENGKCTRGAACRYLHMTSDLGPRNQNQISAGGGGLSSANAMFASQQQQLSGIPVSASHQHHQHHQHQRPASVTIGGSSVGMGGIARPPQPSQLQPVPQQRYPQLLNPGHQQFQTNQRLVTSSSPVPSTFPPTEQQQATQMYPPHGAVLMHQHHQHHQQQFPSPGTMQPQRLPAAAPSSGYPPTGPLQPQMPQPSFHQQVHHHHLQHHHHHMLQHAGQQQQIPVHHQQYQHQQLQHHPHPMSAMQQGSVQPQLQHHQHHLHQVQQQVQHHHHLHHLHQQHHQQHMQHHQHMGMMQPMQPMQQQQQQQLILSQQPLPQQVLHHLHHHHHHHHHHHAGQRLGSPAGANVPSNVFAPISIDPTDEEMVLNRAPSSPGNSGEPQDFPLAEFLHQHDLDHLADPLSLFSLRTLSALSKVDFEAKLRVKVCSKSMREELWAALHPVQDSAPRETDAAAMLLKEFVTSNAIGISSSPEKDRSVSAVLKAALHVPQPRTSTAAVAKPVTTMPRSEQPDLQGVRAVLWLTGTEHFKDTEIILAAVSSYGAIVEHGYLEIAPKRRKNLDWMYFKLSTYVKDLQTMRSIPVSNEKFAPMLTIADLTLYNTGHVDDGRPPPIPPSYVPPEEKRGAVKGALQRRSSAEDEDDDDVGDGGDRLGGRRAKGGLRGGRGAATSSFPPRRRFGRGGGGEYGGDGDGPHQAVYQELCRFYRMREGCKRGQECKYIHSEEGN